MINSNNHQNNNQLDLNTPALLHGYSSEQYKSIATPLETKFFDNYFRMISALPQFKKKNVLDVCELYNLFSNSNKIIYEQYDCVDIDTIKINSNKIFIHFMVNSLLPLSFVDDMIKNIKNNAYPNCEVSYKVTPVDSIKHMNLEVVYSVAEDITLFDESELIDMYHSLTVLSLNPELQNKIKDMLIKSF
jgi:hypothetical protein